MKLELLALGARPPGWVREGVDEYRRRMPRECSLSVTELAIPKRNKNHVPERSRVAEARKIQGARKVGAYNVALDMKGTIWSTEELAERLSGWINDYQAVQFVIGGPDGLQDEIVATADAVWSLSRLTFPHFLVPVLIAEQLYRAWTVIHGHPYHR